MRNKPWVRCASDNVLLLATFTLFPVSCQTGILAMPDSVFESQRRCAARTGRHISHPWKHPPNITSYWQTHITPWQPGLQAFWGRKNFETLFYISYVSPVLCQLVSRYNWTSWIVVQQPLILYYAGTCLVQWSRIWVPGTLLCNSFPKLSFDNSCLHSNTPLGARFDMGQYFEFFSMFVFEILQKFSMKKL